MQFRLRTLLIVLALGPPVLAAARFNETRQFVTPLAGAFIVALFLPYSVRGGLAIAAPIVFINAILMEKDPSGLGPNENIVPFHLAFFAIPAAVCAGLGTAVRDFLEPELP